MFRLYKKEVSYYLNNPIGYIILGLFAAFTNFVFVKDIFVVGSASLRPFFSVLPWSLLVFIPALTMRIFAEEKRANTIEVLLTLPLSETQVVLAKFFALLTLVILALLLTIFLPISLFFLARINLLEVIIGYLGVSFFASSLISLSMFFSQQTKNQIIAFLISIVVIFLLLIAASDFLSTILPKIIQDNLSYLAPLYHLQNFVKGLIDFRSLFYFASFTIVFLFLTIINLEKRN